MEKEFRYIGEKIVDHRYELTETFNKEVMKVYPENFAETGMPEAEYYKIRADLFKSFGEVLYKDEKEVQHQVYEWAEVAAKRTIEYDVSLTEALRVISFFQPTIWEFFQEELNQEHISPRAVIEISRKIDRLVDIVTRVYGRVHEEHQQMIADTAHSALEELSVPMVPIAEGLAVIPLVGAIDTHRAALINEVALTEANSLGLEEVIFDISGVPVLDTMVSNELFTIINSLNLLGINTRISGIRPKIAQTITSLGINFKGIKTFASLHQALEDCGIKRVEVDAHIK
ncbi:STAS domain-containing protein [Thalassobacillus devorans]|uniref:STAS domain-containing protein n=1 Tax=Thalassobacillus devorans TaxID=279813 RepID=UPI000A1CDB4C|nr:STAS domain-containing protein [Thalassobacillus devorans]